MVLFENRRHRLQPEEVTPILTLIEKRLIELLEERMKYEEAETLFKVLFRIKSNRWGRPSYPDFTWSLVNDLLHTEKGPLSKIEEVSS